MRFFKKKPIQQEHALGCAVACVGFRLGRSYSRALELFAHPSQAWTCGYSCEEVTRALENSGLLYKYAAFDWQRHLALLLREGTIVFVGSSPAYPAGHYLIRSRKGWMNSWRNFPRMVPVEAGYQDELPGVVEYVVFEEIE